jgi:hypothetical protein
MPVRLLVLWPNHRLRSIKLGLDEAILFARRRRTGWWLVELRAISTLGHDIDIADYSSIIHTGSAHGPGTDGAALGFLLILVLSPPYPEGDAS